MNAKRRMLAITALLALLVAPVGPQLALAARPYSEIPAGTRFLVELRDKLEAKKVRPGKRFEARTLEALYGSDGSYIAAGARLRGRVSYAENDKLLLRFEQLDTRRGWVPVVVTVVGTSGERHVKNRAGREGELEASGGRGKSAGIGAAVGAGIGAAIGATQAGGKGAAIGAGSGAAAGALIGAAAGGRDLVLERGARIELQLDRPVVFTPRY